ncbi:MAG: acetyl-CoA carboxylase biotin carboxyl carrier protein subunit, partial [Myxococcales bacterium]|nr:acetyl-CoA carboxylase biotin carboxyl carrier protein subunit [Myxococcales bacterium]
YAVQVGDGPLREVRADANGLGAHVLDGATTTAVRLASAGEFTYAHAGGHSLKLRVQSPAAARRRDRKREAQGGTGARTVCSPMPGRVVKVLVTPGQTVEVGDGVVIVEAMKMENELRAEARGVVETIRCAPGDLVDGGAELVVLAAP